MSAKGGDVSQFGRLTELLKKFFSTHKGTDRHPGPQGFTQSYDIRNDVEMFKGAELTGSSHTALYFIQNQ